MGKYCNKYRAIKKNVSCEQLVFAVFAVFCTSGFIYGTTNAWLKYKSEPLSSTTFEVDIRNDRLPSLSLCPYGIQDFHPHHNYTYQEMKQIFNVELLYVSLG